MLSTVMIIKRSEIQAITEVTVEGVTYSLGEHRDFRRHPSIAGFIPDPARLSVAWVHLSEGQLLAPHRHETKSMILVCRGTGEVLGQIEAHISAGDTVLVPPGSLHGFRGTAPDGLDALSIQFEERGLYEDVNNPRVEFASG